MDGQDTTTMLARRVSTSLVVVAAYGVEGCSIKKKELEGRGVIVASALLNLSNHISFRTFIKNQMTSKVSLNKHLIFFSFFSFKHLKSS